MGTFHLDPTVVVPAKNDKTISFPENAITFEYDAKAVEDPSLINAIVFNTKKLKPLASADLDSFLSWQKQLLNINMPFTLPDIGMLQKSSQGQLTFLPEKPPSPKNDTTKSLARQKKEVSPDRKEINTNNKKANPTKTEASPVKKEVNINFQKYKTIVNKNAKNILPFVAVICLGLIILAVYQTFTNQKSDKNPDTTIVEQKNTTITANNKMVSKVKEDTIKFIRPTIANSQQSINNTYIFKIVFFTTKFKHEAQNKINDIYGFGHLSANLYIEDSAYKVAMPFNRPASDTSIIKDSLNKFYSLGVGSVELNKF
jgi:hypothetical protein